MYGMGVVVDAWHAGWHPKKMSRPFSLWFLEAGTSSKQYERSSFLEHSKLINTKV